MAESPEPSPPDPAQPPGQDRYRYDAFINSSGDGAAWVAEELLPLWRDVLAGKPLPFEVS